MKIVSFNINGLRARPHQLAALIEKHQPDVIGLQETKVHDDQFPLADIQALVRHLTSRGIGVLITDHNVRETLGLIDRAYIIHAGEVLTHGRANDIVNNADVRRLYLGDNFSL